MYYKLIRDYVFVTAITPIDAFDYCLQMNSTCGINLEVFIEKVIDSEEKEEKSIHHMLILSSGTLSFQLELVFFPT